MKVMTPESSRATGRYRGVERAMPLVWQASRSLMPCSAARACTP